jgi:hypothetical protein
MGAYLTDTERILVERILPEKVQDLFYSLPGEGKSDAIKHCLIQALRENPTKKVKLVIGDGSLPTYESLIRAEKAEVCLYMQREWPLDVLNRLTSGWWLKDPKDPLSPLIAPTADKLNSFCATSWEGASVMAKYVMGSIKGGLAQQAASGIQMGPDPVIAIKMAEYDDKGKLVSGPETAFGTNGTAHYMATQGHVVDFANRALSLPGHHWFSAHETIMDDVVNIGDLKNPVKVKRGVVIGGPEVGGKALTPIFQRAFGNTLHFQTISKRELSDEAIEATGQKENENTLFFRFYTRDHFPAQGATSVKYRACTRDVDETFPAYYEGPRGTILQFYRDLRDVRNKEVEMLRGL